MNCFLIDFENVNSGGMKGIEHLTENDDVYIFYSDHANSITFDIHHKMNRSHANIHFFKSEIVGKNSLDFQIVSYMGYLVAQKRYQNYFLVSIDRGFDYAVKFWKNYFKQNKIFDLDINRYYSIQDGLNKKSFNPETRQPNNRKVPPTIPTVESEIELQQLKAENVIIDRTSPTIEKHIEKNLNTSTTTKPKSGSSTIKSSTKSTSTTKTYSKSRPTTVSRNTTANSVFVKETPEGAIARPINNPANDLAKDVPAKETPTVATAPTDTTTPKNTNTTATATAPKVEKAETTSTETKEQNSSKYTKNTSTHRNTNTTTNTTNNKKVFNQQKKSYNNGNTNSSAKKNNSQNADNKFSKNKPTSKVETQKPVFTEQYAPDENVKSSVETSTQPKSFTFGKINLDDDSVVTENIKSKAVTTPPVEPPKADNKPKDIKEDTPNNVANTTAKPSEEKSTKPKKTESKKAEPKKADSKKAEPKKTTKAKSQTKKDTPKNATTKDAPKRKVGRPRTRPAQDESKKPKNNKIFEQEIPTEKLNAMLEKISQIDHLNGYSYDDKVKICKVIVFSETKQNCYRAFMSCFGKLRGVEIYGSVKPISQAIKDLYTVQEVK